MAYTWFVLQEKDANYFDQQHLMGMTPIFNCCYTDPYFEKIYGPVFFFFGQVHLHPVSKLGVFREYLFIGISQNTSW